MKNVMKSVGATYESLGIKAYAFIEKHATTFMLVFGAMLLVSGLEQVASAQTARSFSKAAYNDTLVTNAVGNLFCLIEGAFGALIMVVSGLAAMGAYRAAVGMLVVAVGAFILRALVSLFFGTNFTTYVNGNGGSSNSCR